MLDDVQSGNWTPVSLAVPNCVTLNVSDAPDEPCRIVVDVENVPALVFIQP
jgi:hypothetical protein